MFSKRVLLLVLMPFFLGCGLNIGEPAPEDKPINIGGESQCFHRFSETLSAYLSAELKDKQVREFVSCIRYSFESFARRTRGKERNSFAPTEIRDFLQEYFLKEKRISDQLLNDFMVIKQTLLGGPLDRVTRADLSEAIETLQFIEEQAVRLNPYMGLYNFRLGRIMVSQSQQQKPPIEEAVTTLREVAQGIGQRFASANSPYPIEHLVSFLREFRAFAGWEEYFVNARTPEAWSHFFDAYKSIVTGNNTQSIRPKDWPALLTSAASIYGVSMKARYASERQSLMYGEGLEATIRVADDVARIVQSAVDAQENKVISYSQIDRLIDAIEPLGLLPTVASADADESRPMKAKSLKLTARAVFDRIFGDPKVPWQKRMSGGINRFVIKQIEGEFSLWAEIQRWLDRTFQASQGKTENVQRLETLSDRLGPVGASQSLLKLIDSPRSGVDMVTGVVRYIEQNVRPLFRPGDDQVFLTESSQLAQQRVIHGFHNLSRMNLVRGLVALVGRGYSTYAGEGGVFDAGISESEMQAFYLDFREMGVDLQMFDPRSDNAGSRAFREANLFTYSGNGIRVKPNSKLPLDSLMTYPEGMEFLAFIMSGGFLGRNIYRGMMGEESGVCTVASRSAPISVHGYRMVERNCFKEHLMDLMLPQLETMPTMQKELRKSTRAEQVKTAENLMATIYSPTQSNPKYIEWHEIMTISVIMHYTESVMTRYNSNQDTVLDTDEVWNAYKTFQGYMDLMANQMCKQMVGAWSNPNSPAAQIQAKAEVEFGWSATKEWLKRSIKANGCERIPEFVLEAIFAHIVENGRVPSGFWEAISVNYFPKAPWLGKDFRVDRSGLLKVFAALVKASADTKKTSP